MSRNLERTRKCLQLEGCSGKNGCYSRGGCLYKSTRIKCCDDVKREAEAAAEAAETARRSAAAATASAREAVAAAIAAGGGPGPRGGSGPPGGPGPQGRPGDTGSQGRDGRDGTNGRDGRDGRDAEGGGSSVIISGSVPSADFYAVMPPDNVTPSPPYVVGVDIDFPRNGPSTAGPLIHRIGTDRYRLTSIGVYEVNFQVVTEQPGQLVITRNQGSGDEMLMYTVASTGVGQTQIVGPRLIETTIANSTITIRNIGGSLTVTPNSGGPNATTAHLVIKYLGLSYPDPTPDPSSLPL